MEEAELYRVRTGAPPEAIKYAEAYIRRFRLKGLQGMAVLSACLLYTSYTLHPRQT